MKTNHYYSPTSSTAVAGLWLLLCSIGLISADSVLGEDCPGVNAQFRSDLVLGTVRTQAGQSGFLELHPMYGISTSIDSVVHQGPWGGATLMVYGPSEARLLLELSLQEISQHHRGRLQFAELIAVVNGETRRLDPAGDFVELEFPEHKRADGQAEIRLDIGAVVSFRHSNFREEARYSLTGHCLSVQVE
ncbi:hypothetical protein [Pseudohaliea rubra]|uniref:hypothetical protein n=1 Tax=Pseudohaliea rubra TaxID=475795 RepID=UPI0011868D7A|nr:hypothetical protein [Pseudohaliea rubra]